jgi:pepF/M3 family oligoendopeptidase
LDVIYAGGASGEAFATALQAAETEIAALQRQVENLPPLDREPEIWARLLNSLEAMRAVGNELWTVAHCGACENTEDRGLSRIEARCSTLDNRVELAEIPLLDGLTSAPDSVWAAIQGAACWSTLRSLVDNERTRSHLRFPRQQEELVTELSEDGLEAWGRLYRRYAARVRLQVPGPEGELSPGQAWPLLHHSDAAVRARVHQAWKTAWGQDRDLWASTLTHIIGTRVVLQKRLGVGPLDGPLATCRMTRESLDAMLEASSRAKPLLQRYLAKKAALLGVDRLEWQDQWAPVAKTPKWSWAQAQAFVEENFGAWHPELADFARMAFAGRWIEAEDRSAKAAGAWCAVLPMSQQSRIFMTFGGTFSGAMTLAHEMGHAFHNHVTRKLPQSLVRVPMTLAETASVFAENLVRDAALAAAREPSDRLAMLDARLGAGMVFLMNIPARFQFELALHTERQSGELDPDALDELMVRCQRQAYGDSLGSWDPTYWCSKSHFHMSDRAFYNFPYTFGYLFSSLVYARARAEGPSFQATYTELLRRTGTDHAEPLAQDLLGLDLTDPETWWQAIVPLQDDLAAFEDAADAAMNG